MSKLKKIVEKIIQGNSDSNIRFEDLRKVLIKLEFVERVRGSHHIYIKKNITEIINIQPNGDKAKAYQVKQVRELIINYKLVNKLIGE